MVHGNYVAASYFVKTDESVYYSEKSKVPITPDNLAFCYGREWSRKIESLIKETGKFK